MSTTTKPFETYSVMDFWRPWFGQAPGTLVQPILPGWTLNINSNNSSAPQTEANVVAKHSYGRQIGRISDALRALILEQHPNPPETGPFAQFISMCEEIDQIKSESATARLEQIASDLALLKDKDLPEYTRLRDALRRALKQTE
jgi:hypothetical protein